MWLSTLLGKDYLKGHFCAHTESQESSWLPGSQALSSLPLKVSRQNTPYAFIVSSGTQLVPSIGLFQTSKLGYSTSHLLGNLLVYFKSWTTASSMFDILAPPALLLQVGGCLNWDGSGGWMQAWIRDLFWCSSLVTAYPFSISDRRSRYWSYSFPTVCLRLG